MPFANSAAVRDTIGAYTYYDGLAPQRVSAFGLVVGLGRNGSRDCPRNIYSELVQTLYKRQRTAVGVVGEEESTPEEMIDSLDTAVVVVIQGGGQYHYPHASVRRREVCVVLPPTDRRPSGARHHGPLNDECDWYHLFAVGGSSTINGNRAGVRSYR
ncbi:MAG: hypothetical protein IIB57_13175 [Planctomycetes bacterium]|nr:hypothetical protein [Planctomycetota bacterium]